MMAKWSPGGAFGSTLGTQNETNAHKRLYFACIHILRANFRQPPGPHFGRHRLRMTRLKQRLDCAGASGLHIGRLRKKSSWGHIFKRFRRRFGCPIEPRGRRFAQRAAKFGRSRRSCCRSYGNRRNSARTHITSEGKVYLSDKSYD